MGFYNDIIDDIFDFSTAIIDFFDPPSPPFFVLEPMDTVIAPLESGSFLFVGHEGLAIGLIRSVSEASRIMIFVEGGVLGGIGLSGHASSAHNVEVGANGYVRGGPGTAVGIAGGGATVLNEGSISGGVGVTLFVSDHGEIVNTSSIVGQLFGVLLDGGSIDDGPNRSTISNSGTIDGATGIELANATAVVTNLGTIVGRGPRIGTSRYGGVAIDGAEASAGLVVNNAGSLIGQDRALVGSAFADKVSNSGFIGGDVLLGQGRDEYRGQAGTVDGVVRGGKGDDTLTGGSGDETLDGGGQNDLLRGNKGDDILWGGGGRDMFIFKPGDGHDTVVDFASNIDTLDLTSFHFNGFAEVSALAREISGGMINGVLLNLAGHGNGTIFLAEVTMAQFNSADAII